MWPVGTKVVREHSLEMGVGVVIEELGRFVVVFFPESGEKLQISPTAPGTKVVTPTVGAPGLRPDGTIATVVSRDRGMFEFDDGERIPFEQVWPVLDAPTLWQRLEAGPFDSIEDVQNRIEGMMLDTQRRDVGVPSLIGGRVELYPHQLATASNALSHGNVRWLLADEVGLGKTVSAALILSAMIRTGRIESAVIIAPDSLTLQWLGELYRKFHQIFVHVDAERIEVVDAEFGEGSNVFDVHPLSIVSSELLEQPSVRAALEQAPPDLLVIDEAHRGASPLGLASLSKHCLLLTSSAFAGGTEGFAALAAALGLERVPIGPAGLYRQVSAVQREDLPAMPARVAQAIPATAGDLDATDERVIWLTERSKEWHHTKSKSLVFVNSPERANRLKETLERTTGLRVWAFHEEMASTERDIQLSEFRASTCTILVSSGAGSEGRNFQFCDRVVHADLPDDPLVLEQRIGRVDRLGRVEDVGVVYFTGVENTLADSYAALGLFDEVTDGTSPVLEPVRSALREGVRGEALAPLVAEYRAAVESEDSSRPIFPDTYDPEDAERTISEIPADAEELVESFVLGAALRTGVDMLEKPGTARFYFEYGASALVDAIPGVTHGSRYLGTFSRKEAIFASEIDFYASGHPLVEGLIWELDDSEAGRVSALRSKTIAEPSLFVVTRKTERHAPELIRIGPGGVYEPYAWQDLLEIVQDARPSRRSRMVAPDDEALATPLFVLAIRPE